MANIHKKTNDLAKKSGLYLFGTILGYACFVGFWLLHMPLKNPTLTIMGAFISLLVGRFCSKEYQKVSSGYKGEKQTVSVLSGLPKDYHIFNDIRVTFEGKQSQIDNIIVSTNGIYIVETKNHSGDISGNIEDKYWTQHKVGRKGTPYSNDFYSPVKQVGTHTWRLSQFLKQNGVNVWVSNAVYFSNPDAHVDVYQENSKTPVFSAFQTSSLLEYVTKSNDKKLSNEQVNKVIHLLKDLS